jgi:hypothetical protein
MSSRNARMMIKGQERDGESTYFLSYYYSWNLNEQRLCKSFDKSIIALKIALNKLGLIIENIEQNWVLYEIFMQHKKMLHRQIDLLIREFLVRCFLVYYALQHSQQQQHWLWGGKDNNSNSGAAIGTASPGGAAVIQESSSERENYRLRVRFSSSFCAYK